jgi:eukaryotic-like serine/threonine-protein kinase
VHSAPDKSAPRVAAAVAAPTAIAPARNLRALGEAKLFAEGLRDQVAATEQRLRDAGAAARPLAVFDAGVAARSRALAAFANEDFDRAGEGFRSAADSFEAAEAELPRLRAESAVAADAALAECRKDAAIQEYRYLLALEPGNAAAAIGIERAKVCEQVFAVLAAGLQQEQAGALQAAAEQYRAALRIDPKSPGAAEALQSLENRAGDERYQRAFAAALDALRSHRYSAAATAIGTAEKLRPDSADVSRLRTELDGVTGTLQVESLRAEAADDERRERWAEASAAYRAALARDATLRFARDGLLRTENRAALAAELADYIEKPRRLAAMEVRNAAKVAVARANALTLAGPQLAAQAAKVTALLEETGVTVEVALRSDGQTDVSILRVGRLGIFSERRVGLKPGSYIVTGSREGFRDVRREISVTPGQTVISLDIHCEERI